MFFKNRLRKLERTADARECPECLLSADSPQAVRIAGLDELIEAGEDLDKRCGTCDRPWWFVIQVAPLGADEEGEGALLGWPM